MSKLKYMNVLIIPILAYVSFTGYGALTYLPIAYSFLFIPFLELFIKADTTNLSEAEEELRKDNSIYDWQIYLMVPVQCVFVYLFLESMTEPGLAVGDRIGRITGMGLMCGVLGINVAHELGHRTKKHEQFLAKILLLSSLYMHFFIEHNRGHHKNVSTKEDPSSARKNEALYVFWIRSVVLSYFSAWKIETERLRRSGHSFLSIHNQMLLFQFAQLGLLVGIAFFYGGEVTGYFVMAAVMGFLLLETVNYIEHYGLARNKKGDTYERVMPQHSWNSNHIIGRLVLFELSRHSDHHYIASRKYQILRHIDESPQMPTGYPGMMLLATVPPLWFYVMNRKLRKIEVAELKEAA